MKTFTLLICFIGLLLGKANAQHQLRIDITSLANDKGLAMLQLFNEKEQVINEAQQKIKEKQCSFTFNNLATGKYAVRFFHDANSSGKLETNLFGKPTEGYGFSNNATGKFGPPPFREWLFELSENKTITIRTIY